MTEAENAIIDLDKKGKPYTLDVGQRLIKPEIASVKFYEFTQSEIEKLKKGKYLSNAVIYQTAMNAVMDFKESDFAFEDLNHSMLTDLETHFRAKGHKVNTISNYMRTIRAIYNRAIKAGVVDREIYPFRDYSIKYEDPAKRAISQEDIKKIKNAKIPRNTPVWHARNLFMFSFYTMGMNWIDMAMLKVANIENGRINYKRAKTGKDYTVGITKSAQRILNYYLKGKEPADYVFDIVTRDHDPQLLRRDIQYHMKAVNKNLKALAKNLKIKGNITTYVARHTWATLALRGNVKIGVISEGLGHRDIKTTQTYLAKFGSEELDKANEMITDL